MVMVPSWQLEQVEVSLDQATMGHLGVLLVLEFQLSLMESPSVTVPSWQLEQVER